MRQNPWRWAIKNRYLLKYCVESFFYLALSKCVITLFPHKLWGLKSCHFQCETLRDNTLGLTQQILAIQRAIRILARFIPWSSRCLDQALAVQRMLTRRGLPSTLYLGMMKRQGSWMAHAWVRCGNQWVVGYDAGHDYTVVGAYARIF